MSSFQISVDYLSDFFQNIPSPQPYEHDETLMTFLFLTAKKTYRFKRSLQSLNVPWMSNFYKALIDYIIPSVDLSNTLVTLYNTLLSNREFSSEIELFLTFIL